MTGPVLALEEIVVRHRGRPILEVPALTLGDGETLALVGPNGAGKTTLLHTAALLRWPDTGRVTILGQAAGARNAAALRRSLSVVFQDPLLFDARVLANAAAGLRFRGVARAEAALRAQDWLERFGVGGLAQRRARELSGGEAARVALTRAFATEPAILLLDEPFSALDAPTRTALLPMLRERLAESGTAALLVTHDLEEALIFGDRIALMEQGRIVASGPVPGLVARPPSRRAAELLGIETILPARLTRRDGEHTILELRPAGPAVCAVATATDALSAGTAVTFVLSASAARVVRPDEGLPGGGNCLPGRVASVTARSSGIRLIVETPAPIVAVAPWDPGGQQWRPGDEAIVTFAATAVHMIPGEI